MLHSSSKSCRLITHGRLFDFVSRRSAHVLAYNTFCMHVAVELLQLCKLGIRFFLKQGILLEVTVHSRLCCIIGIQN